MDDVIVRGSQWKAHVNRRDANQKLSVASQKVHAVSRMRDLVSVGIKSMCVMVLALQMIV